MQMAKTGRPTKYNDKLTDEICEYIANGMSLVSIAAMNDMPDRSQINKWLNKYPEFQDKYTRARQEQANFYADEIVRISDVEENPNKARIRIDARKWVSSKLLPKKYGDKLDMTSGGEPVNFIVTRGQKVDDGENSDD